MDIEEFKKNYRFIARGELNDKVETLFEHIVSLEEKIYNAEFKLARIKRFIEKRIEVLDEEDKKPRDVNYLFEFENLLRFMGVIDEQV